MSEEELIKLRVMAYQPKAPTSLRSLKCRLAISAGALGADQGLSFKYRPGPVSPDRERVLWRSFTFRR